MKGVKMFDFQFPDRETRRINDLLWQKSPNNKEAFIAGEIKKFMDSRSRLDMLTGQRYYIGNHDILLKKRTAIGENGNLTEITNLPNNRITDNCYRRIVQQKVNYLLGRPMLIKAKDNGFDEKLQGIFTVDFQSILRQIATDSLNCGIGYMYIYIDECGKLAFREFAPYEIIPGWRDSRHKELDYVIRIYNQEMSDDRKPLKKIEFYSKKGLDVYRYERGRLVHEKSGPYFKMGKKGFNWKAIPIIPFKYCPDELPLINCIKPLQDSLNTMLSAYHDNMQEDNRNTILVIKNYDGENLGEFRQNLATYGAVKVRTIDGVDGSVESLSVKVDSENYLKIIELLKKSILENGKGFDAKALRETGNPNQMNIQSMYSDIDLDANGMEAEMQWALARVLDFIKVYLFNTGNGNFFDRKTEIIFNRDVLINENEAIDGCIKSIGLLSKESLLAQHPYVNDVAEELKRIEKEGEKNDRKID